MTQTVTVTRLLTDKADPGRTELRTHAEPAAAAPGEVILAPDLFSLTTNNITYAAFGEAMNYWDFFPTGEAGFGHMPVWGFADVVASAVEGIAVGERFYGYWPIASHLRMRPDRVSERGFYDAAEHRLPLTSAYNQYSRCSTDPSYVAADEAWLALYRPLFVTAFMLADFLQDNLAFGARQLLISSASSKTAYATAFCLADTDSSTPAATDPLDRIALTSPRNADFVQGLGAYDHTVAYADLEALDPDVPTLYVDFSGDADLRARIHHHFRAALTHDCYAGSAANTDFFSPADLPGPTPKFYFAPHQIKKRNADWGPVEVNRRLHASQSRFIAHVAAARPTWMHLVDATGFDAAATVIRTLADSGGDPAEGHVVRLG